MNFRSVHHKLMEGASSVSKPVIEVPKFFFVIGIMSNKNEMPNKNLIIIYFTILDEMRDIYLKNLIHHIFPVTISLPSMQSSAIDIQKTYRLRLTRHFTPVKKARFYPSVF